MEAGDIISQDTMRLPLQLVALRLGIAALLGAVVGFDREVRARSAGLRTHMLICLAACLFTLIGIELFLRFSADGNMDPTRIIEAVTAGVAFLAAGTIIRGEGSIKGLTTGAGMWLAGAIGVATGAGMLVLAAMATALAVIVVTLLRFIEP